MRIVFMGTPDFAVPCLEALLAAGHEVAAVYSQPDKPIGRKQEILPTPVKACATAHGLPVCQPATLRTAEETARLAALAPDCVVVVAYGKLIPQEMLALPPKGFLNVHASLLPKYHGAAPIQWAVVNGEATTGVTTMLLDEGMDTGAILEQAAIPIGPEETAGDLFDRLAKMGADLLLSTLEKWERGALIPTPQEEAKATLAPIIRKEAARLDFALPAERLACAVRGFSPWPVAYTTLAGQRLKVFKARPAGKTEKAPGALWQQGSSLFVACGEGTALELQEIQLEGGRRMTAADWLKGRPVAGGARLD